MNNSFAKPLALLISCTSVIGYSQQQQELQRPNILFIMTDDHATNAIGAYGSRLAHLNLTPVIDRLAHEGILFENAYCNNSICTPVSAFRH